MLYLYNGNKFKKLKDKDQNLSTFKQTYSVDEIFDEQELQIRINTYKESYLYFLPSDLTDTNDIAWDDTEEKAINNYYKMCEEI